mmetsp:Transcript_29933/g.45356  ORF Transcript_29933/g.45356 Transcript_29933/m.45356 type:complete len:96 (-) Transcript_29933:1221-1508(-)
MINCQQSMLSPCCIIFILGMLHTVAGNKCISQRVLNILSLTALFQNGLECQLRNSAGRMKLAIHVCSVDLVISFLSLRVMQKTPMPMDRLNKQAA